MRPSVFPFVAAFPALLSLAPLAPGAVVTLNPVADAFVTSAQPASNFGGGGALAISAPGLSAGELQSVLRFDTSSAFSSFNSTYGAGQWTIQSVTLQLTAAAPNNPVFNAQAAGQFIASWMQNNTWVEGSGTPQSPTTTGITFTTLPSFEGSSDETLGTFSFGGATSGASVYSLALTTGFLSDVSSGGLASLRLYASGSTVSYVFNSRSFTTVANRPVLTITAVPSPAGIAMLTLAGFVTASRRQR